MKSCDNLSNGSRLQISSANDKLCDRCRRLDLEAYVELRVKKGRGTIACIEKASLRSNCQLCTQFGQILGTLSPVRTRVAHNDSFALNFRRIQLESWTGVYFRVCFTKSDRISDFDFDFDFCPTTAIAQDVLSNKASVTICGAMTTKSSDLNLARKWLHTCRSSHTKCQRLKTRNNSLRVIDCKEKRLRIIDSSEPYACLSYVWGRRPTTEQTELTETLENVPQTIMDAISVTLDLGILYLWVDRYCVDQSNPEEKHKIIRNMDKIYLGAEVTIIASAGADPQYGLPGVRNTSRRGQLDLKVGRHVFASTENVRGQINNSTWNSRGWTYQEMLLSRRRLVFTDSQMYFQCASAHYLESLDVTTTAPSSPLHERFRVFPNFEAITESNDLQSRLLEFYQRQLSVNSDTIHAISSVLNSQIIENIDPNAPRHFYGIPVEHMNRQDMGFSISAQALAWTVWHPGVTLEPLKFPMPFPSWSWASVKARCTASGKLGKYREPSTLESPCLDLQINIGRRRCKSGSMIDSLVKANKQDYADFEPNLQVTGRLLTELKDSTTPAGTNFAGACFDSINDRGCVNVVALYLGLSEIKSPLGDSHRARGNCLLLKRLTISQVDSDSHDVSCTLDSSTRSRPMRRRYYRRIGVWTIDGSNIYGINKASKLRRRMLEQLPGGGSSWMWFEKSFDLL